jgi:phosphoribosylglycinamide formyltransferase-1
MMNFAVFVSGYGSNLQAIIDAVRQGAIKGRLVLVVSDKKDAYALERARKAGIKTLALDPKDFAGREEFDKAVIRQLQKEKIELVVLAGFMRILSEHFIRTYRDKVLNIHPSLLPQFKGAHAIKDAFEAGVKTTGVTVHFVTEELDGGPVVLQEKVEVTPGESVEQLEERIHKVEHRIYPKAIDLFVRGKLKVIGGRVEVLL